MHLWTALILGATLASAAAATAATGPGEAPRPSPTPMPAPAPEQVPAPKVPDLAPEPAPAPSPAPTPTTDSPATPAPIAEPIEVGRPDGSRQCEPDSGVSIAAMIATLRDAGITVQGSRSAHDGLNRIAVCGAPTGQFHLFLIDPTDLAAAEALGFRPMPAMPPSGS